MLRNRFENASLPSKCFLLFGIIVASTSLAFFLCDLVYSLLGMEQTVFSPDNLQVVMWIQSFATFVMPSFIAAYLFSPSVSHYLCLDKITSGRIILLSVLLYTSFLPALQALSYWNDHIQLPEALSGIETALRQMEDANKAVVEKLLAVDSVGQLILILLLVSVMAGVGEELLFRGVIQRLFFDRFKNVHAAIWITAFIFSAIHFQFYGFFPRLLLGAFFGYLFVWSGSIYLPMLMHMLNNASSVVFTYLNEKGVADIEAFENLGADSSTYIYVALSLVITALLVFYLRRVALQREREALKTE